eukprot:CAMPEP_0202905344 /NCGR_PEP_ID=MMETSP1392-20130828/33751_1 /ASSEMBLY_ACC=CAM_ASM_000868 /TAXON_ID=225041 /ORGANISM="Chlamydomonas chlamydogama, Strain SAG 11-48b" /LENGTH=280 /DNA_ID=CAMNT_0049593391 /DNA_START=131 /DNA_END=973 /DNA_ORIENTATION=+
MIWTVEGKFQVLPFVKAPVRMTILGFVVPNASKPNLIVYSPFQPTAELVDSIKKIGNVAFVVAPNSMHHVFAGPFKEAFPGCKLVGAQVVANKRFDLAFEHVLKTPKDVGQVEGWPIETVLVHLVEGCDMLGELALLHRPSKTLVLCDMAFNYEHGGEVALPGPPVSWYLRLTGGHRRCCVTEPFRWMVDAPVLKDSLGALLRSWDFEQVIMAHGSVIPSGGKQALTAGTYSWASDLASKLEATAKRRAVGPIPAEYLPYAAVGAAALGVGALLLLRRSK